MKAKEILIFIIIIAVVIAIIFFIYVIKPSNDITEEETICIGENSLLVVSKTCGHCATQKEMFRGHLDHLNIAYIDEDPDLLEKYNLSGVPSWIINEQTYPGVRHISEIKELTGC